MNFFGYGTKRHGVRNDEHASFRASVPQKRIVVEDDSQNEWVIYDTGPKSVECPLIFLPPVSGAADVFFKQLLALSAKGYRVISVEYPPFWTIENFCNGFALLLAQLQLPKVHLFGASLGGYLAQRYAEHCYGTLRVISLILCNAFTDTSIFDRNESALVYWAMPPAILKKIILSGYPARQQISDPEIAESIDIMVDSLDSLTQSQLASRLTLNCSKSKVNTSKVSHLPITILDVYDECALSPSARDNLHSAYEGAKKASLKAGGNFPYLSRGAEVNTFIKIHLKQFEATQYDARERNLEELSVSSDDRCDSLLSASAASSPFGTVSSNTLSSSSAASYGTRSSISSSTAFVDSGPL